MPAKPFVQSEFDDFMQNPGIDSVPGSVRLLYDEYGAQNFWILKFWFVHRNTEDQEADAVFWGKFVELKEAIGLDRLKFYDTYHRLGTLMDWVQSGKLSIAQVKAYDAVESYEKKPAPLQEGDDETVQFSDHGANEADNRSEDDNTTLVGRYHNRALSSNKPVVDTPPSPPPKPLGFSFDEAHYLQTVSRKLPHLLANDSFQEPHTPDLTPKEQAFYDLDEENPRYHASRKMPFRQYFDHLNRRWGIRILSYLDQRYHEEYLDDFFDQVILPLGEERARLFLELKALNKKISTTTVPIAPSLEQKRALLEEKIDLLSGCIKQQCAKLRQAVIEMGHLRVNGGETGVYYPKGFEKIPLSPLMAYQYTDPRLSDSSFLKKDTSYRCQRMSQTDLPEAMTTDSLSQKAQALESIHLETHTKNSLPYWRNPIAAFCKVMLGVAVGLAGAALLIPSVVLGAGKEWWHNRNWGCDNTTHHDFPKHYPKVRQGFGSFFRSHTQQACFEAEKHAKAVHDKKRAKENVLYREDAWVRSGWHDNLDDNPDYQEFKKWEEGASERYKPSPRYRPDY